MKIETETQDAEIVRADSVQPMTYQQRKARGFCTCPLKTAAGGQALPGPEPCEVHPRQLVDCAEDRQAHGLLFFDDRRNRYVTWADAVEAMRQPRYTGATSKGLRLYTWMNLIRLLEALCVPASEPAAEITESLADALIRHAGQNFPHDGLASLMVSARGGETEALCKVFRAIARNAEAGRAEVEEGAESALTLVGRGVARDSAAA